MEGEGRGEQGLGGGVQRHLPLVEQRNARRPVLLTREVHRRLALLLGEGWGWGRGEGQARPGVIAVWGTRIERQRQRPAQRSEDEGEGVRVGPRMRLGGKGWG